MQPTILITGAAGRTGLPLVKALSATGASVRAMVHTPEQKTRVQGVNVEVAVADFNDRGAVERVLEGIQKVYLVSPVSPEMVAVQTAFVDTALDQGVRRLVKLSALGSAPDSPVGILRWHAEIEEHVRKAGIEYTFLQAHAFMENFFSDVETVRRERAVYSPLGDAKFNPIAAQDIASSAAKILLETGHEGMTYTLTGPESVTYAQIARALGEAISRSVKYVPLTLGAAKQEMLKGGVPGWLADDLIALSQTWIEGKGDVVSTYVARLTGRKPISVREFFLKHKDLFLAVA